VSAGSTRNSREHVGEASGRQSFGLGQGRLLLVRQQRRLHRNELSLKSRVELSTCGRCFRLDVTIARLARIICRRRSWPPVDPLFRSPSRSRAFL
jgi:hypothetical protein